MAERPGPNIWRFVCFCEHFFYGYDGHTILQHTINEFRSSTHISYIGIKNDYKCYAYKTWWLNKQIFNPHTQIKNPNKSKV